MTFGVVQWILSLATFFIVVVIIVLSAIHLGRRDQHIANTTKSGVNQEYTSKSMTKVPTRPTPRLTSPKFTTAASDAIAAAPQE